MAKYNRRCAYCGNLYYACRSCIGIHSWNNVYCSINCYLEDNKTKFKNKLPKIINDGGDDMKIVLRGGLRTTGKTIDIVGYNLEVGKFDCTDGKTYKLEDFSYFIVPADEMKEYRIKPKETLKKTTTKPETESVKATTATE